MLLDHYSLRARLQPALLVLLPVALTVIAWVPTSQVLFGGIWSLLGLTGFTFLLAQIARDRGKWSESDLWASWGGKPTTQLLRHSSSSNKVSLARVHARLSAIVGKPFPSEKEELNSPDAAEDIYDDAVAVLRNKTRDAKAFPLIYKENVSYGFRRNLHAMRAAGTFIALLATIAAGLAAVMRVASNGDALIAWICTSINAMLLSLWILRFNSKWVRLPAFAYAERILEASESIDGAKAK
jgi:hypothetical protein